MGLLDHSLTSSRRSFQGYQQNISCPVMKSSVVCGAVFISVVSASYQPHPLPFHHGAFGGPGGKKGGISPFLLTSLLGDKCVEKYPGKCTQPTTANASPSNDLVLCGHGTGCGSGSRTDTCCPCCTCPDSAEASAAICTSLNTQTLNNY